MKEITISRMKAAPDRKRYDVKFDLVSALNLEKNYNDAREKLFPAEVTTVKKKKQEIPRWFLCFMSFCLGAIMTWVYLITKGI